MNAAALEPPDIHYLNAAQGWFELGDSKSAGEELEHIAAPLRLHPDVLEVRHAIHARAGEWAACFEITSTIVQLDPSRVGAWIDRSNALHFLGRYQAAWDLLTPALAKFPNNVFLPYNIACFACRLDRLDEARAWLKRACALVADGPALKGMALDDPDLEPLRGEISKW